MKKKKYDHHKTMREVSRESFNVQPTRVLKNKKKKRLEKEIKKEIDTYIKGEI